MRWPRHGFLLLGLVFVLVHSGGTVRADPLSAVGFTDRAAGKAGAMHATDDPLSAAAYNPAAAALAKSVEIGFGVGLGAPRLKINGQGTNIEDTWFSSLGIVIPIPVHKDWTLAMAGSFYLPMNGLANLQLRAPTDIQVVMWENRLQRISSRAALGLNFQDRIAIGVGVSVFGSVDGDGLDLDVVTLPGRTVANTRLSAELPWAIAPFFGIHVRPLENLRLGVGWEEPQSLRARMNANSFVRVPGTDIEGDTIVQAQGIGFYSPRTLYFATEVILGDTVLSAQLEWQQWSRIPQVASHVRLMIDLGIDIDTMALSLPAPDWKDVWVPRLAIEHRVALGNERHLDLRGGYAFVDSPVPEQRGISSFADSALHVLGASVSLGFSGLERHWNVGFAVGSRFLTGQTVIKDAEYIHAIDYRLSGVVYTTQCFVRVGL